jgi:hypothetical protein
VHEYHESDKKPGWLEWAIIIVLVVVVVIACLVLLGPQIRPIYNRGLGNL